MDIFFIIKDPENLIICLGTVLMFCVPVFTDGFQNGLLPCLRNQSTVYLLSLLLLNFLLIEGFIKFPHSRPSAILRIVQHKVKPHIFMKNLPTVCAQTKNFSLEIVTCFFSSMYEEVSKVIDTF
jgi:hypothetical protein